MMDSVDLRELAIDRGDTDSPKVGARRHLLTRYVLPLILLSGFLALMVWASRDYLFPPKAVTVLPVFSNLSAVQQEGTPLFQAAGWIEPRPTPIRVAALAPGVVASLLVVENQPVEKGEPVAELVKEDARLAHDRVRAMLRLREAEQKEAEAALSAAVTRYEQPVHLDADLKEAEASLAQIETQMKYLPFETRRAEADYRAASHDYQGKVSAREVVAGIEIEEAKRRMESAEARLEGLEDRLDSLKRERAALIDRRNALRTRRELLADETRAKEESEARLHAAEARVAQAEVAVSEAKLQLERMTVRAPVEGRIYRLIAHPGTRIGSGMGQTADYDGSTVVTMYDPKRLQVRVDVRFEDLPSVKLGQPVEIENPALPRPITGKVLYISSEADIQKNTLEVKIEIPDPPAVFKPEMLVDATFLAPREPETSEEPSREWKLYVPAEFIRQDEAGSFVWVADRSEGIARRVSVETGKTGNEGLVEVTSGLTVASRMIADGIEGLEDGDRIHVTDEAQRKYPELVTSPSASEEEQKNDAAY
jgi:RND family efflux transporter MFP subunit